MKILVGIVTPLQCELRMLSDTGTTHRGRGRNEQKTHVHGTACRTERGDLCLPSLE